MGGNPLKNIEKSVKGVFKKPFSKDSIKTVGAAIISPDPLVTGAVNSITGVPTGDYDLKAGFNKALDPGNFFGKDETKAGYSMSGMLDPGGEIALAAGDKSHRSMANVGTGFLDTPQMTGDLPEPMEVPEIPSMADTSAAEIEEKRKRDAAKRGRASTILTSSAGGGLGRANIGAATLGGR